MTPEEIALKRIQAFIGLQNANRSIQNEDSLAMADDLECLLKALTRERERSEILKKALEDIAQMIIKHKTPEQIARECLARIAEMEK